MQKTFYIFIFILLFGCKPDDSVFNKLSQDAVILAFGDSLTYGTGAAKDSSYPVILAELSLHKVINAGVPGEISQAGLRRLPALLDQYQPELLLLTHGGNDMLRKISAQQTQANLTQMIVEAKQRDIQVLILGVPTPSLFFLSSASFYQEVANETKTEIEVEILSEILGNNILKADTIHPNGQGYKRLAESIYNLLLVGGAL